MTQNLARPIFVCGDCKEVLTSNSLEKNACEYCKVCLCPCICHVNNYKKCEDCLQHHEGQ